MFNNIGKKCKTLAVVTCIIGIVGSVIAGIVLFASSSYYADFTLAGFLTIILGSLFSWIESWALYAIGEAADRSDYSAIQNEELKQQLKKLQDSIDALKAPETGTKDTAQKASAVKGKQVKAETPAVSEKTLESLHAEGLLSDEEYAYKSTESKLNDARKAKLKELAEQRASGALTAEAMTEKMSELVAEQTAEDEKLDRQSKLREMLVSGIITNEQYREKLSELLGSSEQALLVQIDEAKSSQQLLGILNELYGEEPIGNMAVLYPYIRSCINSDRAYGGNSINQTAKVTKVFLENGMTVYDAVPSQNPDRIVCPVCHAEQYSGASSCKSCHALFRN